MPSAGAPSRKINYHKAGYGRKAYGTVEIVPLTDFFTSEFTADLMGPIIAKGMEVLKPAVLRNLERSIIHFTRSKGEDGLIGAIDVSHTFFRKKKTLFYANVFFHRKNAAGIDQGNKANWKEYGTKERETKSGWETGKAPASHFAKKALESSESQIISAMGQELELRIKLLNERN